MSPFLVICLFGLTIGQTASLCAPSEYTIHVEKRECAYCLAINTTICAGFCMTRLSMENILHVGTPDTILSFTVQCELYCSTQHCQFHFAQQRASTDYEALLALSAKQDSNGKKLLLRRALSQNVCTYKEMLYQTALIPGCPPHTVPYYSYPVAVSCKCGKCNTDYSDCVHEKVRTNYCTKPQKLCNV